MLPFQLILNHRARDPYHALTSPQHSTWKNIYIYISFIYLCIYVCVCMYVCFPIHRINPLSNLSNYQLLYILTIWGLLRACVYDDGIIIDPDLITYTYKLISWDKSQVTVRAVVWSEFCRRPSEWFEAGLPASSFPVMERWKDGNGTY